MIFYIASPTYESTIHRTVIESGEVLVGSEQKEELFLFKYFKENISHFDGIDTIIVDLSVCADVDEEILQAFEMLRMMYCNIRIIVLAANRYAGDELLTKCFQMGIYDLIATDDFLTIKEELMHSIITGKQYKDALQFKESNPLEKVIVKQEIKQKVNKVMIGISGTTKRIGVTHNSIVLANYLRKRGYMVAIAELNASGAFKRIQESFEEKILDNAYFSLDGVDYYFEADTDKLGSILGKSYNFIICDFGSFEECDRVTFNKSDVRIIVAGAKPWEVNQINKVFGLSSKETLEGYHFCFNFVSESLQKDVKEGMESCGTSHFLTYHSDPFHAHDFADAELILEQYMPVKVEEKKKKGLFGRRNEKK